MVTYRTDTGAVTNLGGGIVSMAGDVDDVVAGVAGIPNVGDPPHTAAALVDFTKAYRQTTERLQADVVALGRLTQAAGAEYAAVEAAAAQVDHAQGPPVPVPSTGAGTRGPGGRPRQVPPPADPFGPIGRVHPLHDLGIRDG
jgi:hypothetical protein